MIDEVSYARIRAKFRSSGSVDDELYELLLRLVGAVVFGGLVPRSLSPNGVWDADSAQEAAHDWIVQRLLKPGNNSLLGAFDIGLTPRRFLNSLEMNFRDHLKSRAARTELDNLGRRVGRLLDADVRFREWLPQSRPSQSWWGLSEWDDPSLYDGRDDDLVSTAWSLGEIALLRYGSGVGRASPILSTTALGTFLEDLFERVDALLTRGHLRKVLERRFDLRPATLLSFEDNHGAHEIPEEPAVSAEELREAATFVLAEMSGRQADVLVLKHDEKTLEEIAALLGISRGTADNELKRVGLIIDRHADGDISRAALLEILLDELSE